MEYRCSLNLRAAWLLKDMNCLAPDNGNGYCTGRYWLGARPCALEKRWGSVKTAAIFYQTLRLTGYWGYLLLLIILCRQRMQGGYGVFGTSVLWIALHAFQTRHRGAVASCGAGMTIRASMVRLARLPFIQADQTPGLLAEIQVVLIHFATTRGGLMAGDLGVQ